MPCIHNYGIDSLHRKCFTPPKYLREVWNYQKFKLDHLFEFKMKGKCGVLCVHRK